MTKLRRLCCSNQTPHDPHDWMWEGELYRCSVPRWAKASKRPEWDGAPCERCMWPSDCVAEQGCIWKDRMILSDALDIAVKRNLDAVRERQKS